MNIETNREKRRYSMEKRSDAAAERHTAILDATVDLYWQLPIEEVTLAMIAERSGVTVQTIIRKFGGRDEVFTAAAERTREDVETGRELPEGADLSAAIAVLVEHYEIYGDGVMKLLSEENRLAAIGEVVDRGRRVHREWCEGAFAADLAAVPASRRRVLLAQLVALCDVYTWKLLRRDSGLTRKATENAIIEMIAALKGATK